MRPVDVVFCWIPSHVGILGNEKADAAAKSAFSLPVTRMKLPATGMYPRITKLISDEWQEVWDCCAGNKLHAIRRTVGGYTIYVIHNIPVAPLISLVTEIMSNIVSFSLYHCHCV